MDELLENYILSHTDPEPELLKILSKDSHVRLLNGRMVSGHYQGRLIVMLCHMIRPKRVLELGTFTGYSALCFAEGTDEDAEVHTIEHNDELEDVARSWFSRSESGYKIKLHIGDALKMIPQMEGLFDLVFIDADKRQYPEYYEAVFPKVKSGGFIFADNTLWGGKVLGKIAKNDAQSIAVSKFNNYLAKDSRVEKIILPIRDGLTIIYKK
ncbi:MAG: O-methyltransferase [Bacteroidales bacterium]|nr:O-methyltransferase [Bacteroidales bacterium]MDD3907769.1 O-methyltransferase [Bacteroidales bacterium]MDD4713395.1 O-methyltransferase [Bacteroidales bacterium]